MYAYKDVLELAGYTTRLYTLLSTLHNLPSEETFITSPDTIAFSDVDVVIPSKVIGDDESVPESAGTVLIRDLNFELRVGTGEHLMITGTNGVGKTAIARVIAGLWSGEGGEVTRPPVGVDQVFVVPQRAYMVTGTLLDQFVLRDLSIFRI